MVRRLRTGQVVTEAPDGTPVLSDDPETLPGAILTCEEASQYLWSRWRLRRSDRRLAQLRSLPVGTGPVYLRDGCCVRYRQASLDQWAMKQLGEEHGSTSDESARRQTAAAA